MLSASTEYIGPLAREPIAIPSGDLLPIPSPILKIPNCDSLLACLPALSFGGFVKIFCHAFGQYIERSIRSRVILARNLWTRAPTFVNSVFHLPLPFPFPLARAGCQISSTGFSKNRAIFSAVTSSIVKPASARQRVD